MSRGNGQARLLSTPLPREEAQALAGMLGEAGWPLVVAVSAFEVVGDESAWQVEVFCSPEAEAEQALAQVQQIADLAGVGEVSFHHAPLPDMDWVAHVQQGLAPVVAGRFFVHGSHDRARRRRNAVNLEIEAGPAFGTGHHGTTQGCLLALEWLLRRRLVRPCVRRPVRVLDVGTGSGVLGIAAARVLQAQVLGTDIDSTAVDTARNNARLNGAPGMRLVWAAGVRHGLVRRLRGGERRVRVRCAARCGVQRLRVALRLSRMPQESCSRWRVLRRAECMAVRCGGYDLVFANILARPLVHMAAELTAQLRGGGWLVLSGLLQEQERMVRGVYVQHGLQWVRHWRIDGWSTLLLRKPAGGQSQCA